MLQHADAEAQAGKYRLRFRYVLFSIGVIMTAHQRSLAQADPVAHGISHEPVSPIVKEAVTTILDGNTPQGERFAAFAQLQKANPHDLKAGLRELLRFGPSDFASQAAATALLLEKDDQALNELIVEQMPKWLDGHRRDLLRRRNDSPRLRFFARGIVGAVIERKIVAPLKKMIGSVEYSVRILAFANDPQDEVLFRRAVIERPSSYGLWLALGRRGPLPTKHGNLARAVMQDERIPYLARVAAAGACAQIDARCAKLALGEIRIFLEEYGARDMSPNTLAHIGDGHISGSLLEENERYTDTVWVLGNLLNLDQADAEQLTLKYLMSPDPKIRRTLAVVAARRWPKQFLAETNVDVYPQYEPQEYEMFLALIAYLHPELKAVIEARIQKSMINKLSKRISTGVLSWWCEEAGGFVMGW